MSVFLHLRMEALVSQQNLIAKDVAMWPSRIPPKNNSLQTEFYSYVLENKTDF